MGLLSLQGMHSRHSIRALSVAAAIALLLGYSAPAGLARVDLPNLGQEASPVGLYHHVWQLIRDRYYDAGYNGQRWARWEHRYDKYLKTLPDSRKAIETMLASLGDRYTRYLDPEAFDDETSQIEAKLFGIGIQMGLDKTHKLVVIAPIEGSPAAAAGLMPMDEIAEVDGKATSTMSVEQASKMIRGPINTPVTLTINRNNERKPVTITRGEIQIRSVQTAQMLSDEVGYIRLSTFMSQHANDEIREALHKLSPARGIIIDLRNNPGGLVTNALDICSMFMDGGIIVSTVDREGHVQSSRAPGSAISKQPIVLLINHGSASASEITSGALHDTKRAQLVGEKTFGKGLVQGITRLEDGSGVNITIARYRTPNNIDIHKRGIEPDFEIELRPEDYEKGRGPWWLDPEGFSAHRKPDDFKDIQLKKAFDVLQDDLEFASANPYQVKLNPFPNLQNPGLEIGQ